VNKTTRNIIYVAIQQFVNTVLPFLIIPYVARVLGVVQNGVYSYSLTITNIFAVIFSFGFAIHGSNIIAQSEISKRQIKYIEIQILRTLFLLLGGVLFLGLILFQPLQYSKTIFLLQGLIIGVSLLDVSWYFQGTGEFKKIVSRNIVVKFIGSISVFILVKNPDDLWIYILVMNGSQLIGNFVLFLETIPFFKYFNRIQFSDFKKHIKISFFLFIPNISVLTYSSFDKMLLGGINDIQGLSNYQQVQRIISFIYAFLMIPSTVLIQKIAAYRGLSEDFKAEQLINRGLNIYTAFGTYLIFGIAICSNNFINIFLGHEYSAAINLLIIMSPIILFKTVGGVIGGWYLIPLGRVKLHSFPLVIGTLISILLNILLTPKVGVIAATIIFTFTELLVVLIQFAFLPEIRKLYDVKLIIIILASASFSYLLTNLINEFIVIPGITNLYALLLKVIFYSLVFIVITLASKHTRLYFFVVISGINKRGEKYQDSTN
jgi:O-antigen/teichoic acid export membrane protein